MACCHPRYIIELKLLEHRQEGDALKIAGPHWEHGEGRVRSEDGEGSVCLIILLLFRSHVRIPTNGRIRLETRICSMLTPYSHVPASWIISPRPSSMEWLTCLRDGLMDKDVD